MISAPDLPGKRRAGRGARAVLPSRDNPIQEEARMPKPSAMERRRFIQLVAASGAAVLAAPLARPARAAVRRSGTAEAAPRPVTVAIRKEIASQKKSLADALKVIRDYKLPPGSPPAFVFHAMRSKKGR